MKNQNQKKQTKTCPKCGASKIREAAAGYFEGDITIAFCDSGLLGCGWQGYSTQLILKDNE